MCWVSGGSCPPGRPECARPPASARSGADAPRMRRGCGQQAGGLRLCRRQGAVCGLRGSGAIAERKRSGNGGVGVYASTEGKDAAGGGRAKLREGAQGKCMRGCATAPHQKPQKPLLHGVPPTGTRCETTKPQKPIIKARHRWHIPEHRAEERTHAPCRGITRRRATYTPAP